MNPDEQARNRWAHQGLDRIGFAHRTLSAIVAGRALTWWQSANPSQAVPPRTLDVGSGTGYLLSRQMAMGWNCWGLDPFPRGRSLQPPLSSRTIAGTLDCIRDGCFDSAFAIEVLEHVEQYLLMIQGLLRVLRPGGLLLLTVPNDWDFVPVATPSGTKPKHGHLWRFDRKALESDLRHFSNSVAIKSVYSRRLDRRLLRPCRLMPPAVVARLSDRMVGARNDGAWLLAAVQKDSGAPASPVAQLTPSARRFDIPA